MNKQRERIIAYLDGSMADDEMLQFEKVVGGNIQLQKEVEDLRSMLSSLKAGAEPSIDESYFINMLPEFHRRHSNKKKFLFSKLAYSLSTVAAVVLILFIIFNPGKTTEYKNIQELSTNLSEQEINEALDPYENRYSLNDLVSPASSKTDSIVNNLVEDELNLSSNSVDNKVAEKYLNTDELLSSLNENEANELYSQLINTDIIKGAR